MTLTETAEVESGTFLSEKLTPTLCTLLLQCGGVSSKTEYRRYIQNGAIKVQVRNDETTEHEWIKIRDENYIPVPTDIIKCGKYKTYECRLTHDADDAPNSLFPQYHL